MQYVHAFRKLLFMPSELTLGAEYSFDELEDRSIGYAIDTDQTVHIVGGYFAERVEDQKMVAAGRRPRRQAQPRGSRDLQPRANIRFNPSESVNLRVSYAGGYRAPQAFDEDMHIAIVGGKRVRIRLADDLKEERSHSVSLFGRSLPHVREEACRPILLVEGSLYQTGGMRPPCGTSRTRPTADKVEGDVATVRGATVRGLNAEGRGGLHPLVRTPGGK